MGKTYLARQFQKIAKEAKALTACSDKTETDVSGVMGHIAAHLKEKGHELNHSGSDRGLSPAATGA